MVVRLTDDELKILHGLGQGQVPGAVVTVLTGRLETAKEAFLSMLNTWHETDPDHCGGECFRESDINSILGLE